MPRNQINVFISSTSYALPDYRRAMLKVLKTLRFHPRGDDYRAASDGDPVALCKQHIFDSDIFIGVYAHHLGWQPPDHGGKSLSEIEYNWAGETMRNGQAIPRLCFIMDDNYDWPQKQLDQKVELDTFKERISRENIGFFTTPDDLATQATVALQGVLKTDVLRGYEQALVKYMEKDDKRGQASVLQNIAGLYEALGNKEKSVEYYRQTLVLFVKLGDKMEQATTLNNIGLSYQALGEKGKALGCYQQALPLCIEAGNKAEQAATLNNLGGVYQTLGESKIALDHFLQSRTLYVEMGDTSGQALTLNNMGGLYSALGQQEKALENAQQALSLYLEMGDKGEQAGALNSIGLAYSRLGEKAKALSYYESALALRIEAGDAHGEAVTRSNIAAILWDQGQQAEASNYLEQAHKLASGTGASADIQDDYLHFSTASGVGANLEQ